jgi:hypothetical protein
MSQSKIILEPMEDLERRLKEERATRVNVYFYALNKKSGTFEHSLFNDDMPSCGNLMQNPREYAGFFFERTALEVLPSRYAKEPSQDEVKAFDAGYSKAVEKMMGMVEREKKLSYEKGYQDALTKMRAAIVTAEKGE